MIDFDDTVKEILGRPNFTCAKIAERLRGKGLVIENKSEAEQANVLYWLLTMYEKHGCEWRTEGDKFLNDPDSVIA